MKQAQYPRTFWYVDLEQREMQVSSGRNLYQATILANRIYDFRNDPEGHKEMHRHPCLWIAQRNGVERDARAHPRKL